MTGTLLPGLALDAVVVVAWVVVVVGVVFVAEVVAARVVGVSVVGVSVVVVVWRVVVVAAVVGGVVADGAAVAAVVGVTRREEGGRLDVVMVEFTLPVDRCAAPFPLGPIVRANAVTSATAPTVAPMIATLLRFSHSVSVGGRPAIGAGGAESEAFTAGPDEVAAIGESDDERSACSGSPLSISPGSCGPWSCDSKPSLVTG